MKKIGILLMLFITVGCSKNTQEPIEEPEIPTSEIESNNKLIERFEGNINEEQKKMDKESNEMLIGMHREYIDEIQKEIDIAREQNILLEKTLVYNDNFSVVDGTGIYIDERESILTTGTFASSFNDNMLQELNRYKGEIEKGIGLIAVAPFQEDGDQHSIITIYITQEKLDKVDFEEALESDDNELYKIASYVNVHRDLKDDIKDKGDIDDLPDLISIYSVQSY